MTTQDILTFLKKQFAIDVADITETTGLFSEGFLDSFSIVDLILFIETTAGIQIDPVDVNLDNLDTIVKIQAFVQSKGVQRP
ncbi:MAG: acyl carrier protein [Verrucomicrobia bacterium]|nr:acyl carrier protein [Verrucomicrobiota bacterium]